MESSFSQVAKKSGVSGFFMERSAERASVRTFGSLSQTTLRARPLQEKAAVMNQLEERLWPGLASGEISVTVEAVLPITKATEGHGLIASDQTIGKVILDVAH